MQLLRRAGKRPGIDHVDKDIHRHQAIHPHSYDQRIGACIYTPDVREPQDSAEGFLE
jgi:hypothetical protein